MKTKPYTAKTLTGAQRRVRELMVLHAKTRDLLEQYARERKLMARLAAREPQFFNPLEVMEAERIRDEILRNERHPR